MRNNWRSKMKKAFSKKRLGGNVIDAVCNTAVVLL